MQKKIQNSTKKKAAEKKAAIKELPISKFVHDAYTMLPEQKKHIQDIANRENLPKSAIIRRLIHENMMKKK